MSICLFVLPGWQNLAAFRREQNSVCSGLKFSSESELFGGGPPCPLTISATLIVIIIMIVIIAMSTLIIFIIVVIITKKNVEPESHLLRLAGHDPLR